jgi:hypothetical protein
LFCNFFISYRIFYQALVALEEVLVVQVQDLAALVSEDLDGDQVGVQDGDQVMVLEVRVYFE